MKRGLGKLKKQLLENWIGEVKIDIIDEKKESYIDYLNDKVILHISSQNKLVENVERLFRLYTREVLLGSTYNALKNLQRESVEDYTSKELSSLASQPKVVEILATEINDNMTNNQEGQDYGNYINGYKVINKNGLFFTIFLPELHRIGKSIGESYSDFDAIQMEFDRLLDFLYKIATKDVGERVQLAHETTITKIAIILIASDEVLLSHGKTPYVKRAEKLMKNNFQTIYIVSAGYKNDVASRVVDDICKKLPLKRLGKKDVKIGKNKFVRIYKLESQV